MKTLKNDSAVTSDEIRLIKKQHKEEVRLMREKIADHEAFIRKMKADRIDWEGVKIKCEADLEHLLKDYALQRQQTELANQRIVCMREQRAELHDQNKSLHEQNIALKGLFNQLEKKYHDTFSEKRSEYVGMKQRVQTVEEENSMLSDELQSVEEENSMLKDELSTSSKMYENLLLMNNNNNNNNNNNHHEYLVENQQLRSRIKEIETWFDEAWAGFRLEVLSFERKLEQKDEVIRQLKGEDKDETPEHPSKQFQQT